MRLLMQQEEHQCAGDNATGEEEEVALPSAAVSVIEVLGLHIDARRSTQQHINGLLDRAKIRMGILARVSGRTWGLETGGLRMTADSPLTSLM